MAYLSRPFEAGAAIAIGTVVIASGGQVSPAAAPTDSAIGMAATGANGSGDEIAVVTGGAIVRSSQGDANPIAPGDRVVSGPGVGVILFVPGAYIAGDVVTIVGIARSASTNPGDGLDIDVALDTVVI